MTNTFAQTGSSVLRTRLAIDCSFQPLYRCRSPIWPDDEEAMDKSIGEESPYQYWDDFESMYESPIEEPEFSQYRDMVDDNQLRQLGWEDTQIVTGMKRFT